MSPAQPRRGSTRVDYPKHGQISDGNKADELKRLSHWLVLQMAHIQLAREYDQFKADLHEI